MWSLLLNFTVLSYRLVFFQLLEVNLFFWTPVKICFQVFHVYFFDSGSSGPLITAIVNSCFEQFKFFRADEGIFLIALIIDSLKILFMAFVILWETVTLREWILMIIKSTVISPQQCIETIGACFLWKILNGSDLSGWESLCLIVEIPTGRSMVNG